MRIRTDSGNPVLHPRRSLAEPPGPNNPDKPENTWCQSGPDSGPDAGKRGALRAPFCKVHGTGVFFQSDDFIDPPKLGKIPMFREGVHQVAGGGPELLL